MTLNCSYLLTSQDKYIRIHKCIVSKVVCNFHLIRGKNSDSELCSDVSNLAFLVLFGWCAYLDRIVPYQPNGAFQSAGLFLVPRIFKSRVFSFHVPLLLNQLPDWIQETETLSTCKIRFKSFFLPFFSFAVRAGSGDP